MGQRIRGNQRLRVRGRGVQSLALVLALGVAGTACGSSSSGSSPIASSTSATIDAAPTTAAAPADSIAPTSTSTTSGQPTITVTQSAQETADEAAAHRALLTLADLPEGWTASPADNSDDSENDPGLEQFMTCLGATDTALGGDDGASVDSPDFSSPNGDSVFNSISFTGSMEEIRAMVKILDSPEMMSCTKDAVATAIAAGLQDSMDSDLTVADKPVVSVGTIEVKEVPTPEVGDFVKDLRLTVPMTGPGGTITMYADFLFATKGRAPVIVTGMGLGAALATTMTIGLLRTVVDRLSAA